MFSWIRFFVFVFVFVLFSIIVVFFHFAHINHVQKSLHCFPINNILFLYVLIFHSSNSAPLLDHFVLPPVHFSCTHSCTFLLCRVSWISFIFFPTFSRLNWFENGLNCLTFRQWNQNKSKICFGVLQFKPIRFWLYFHYQFQTIDNKWIEIFFRYYFIHLHAHCTPHICTNHQSSV